MAHLSHQGRPDSVLKAIFRKGAEETVGPQENLDGVEDLPPQARLTLWWFFSRWFAAPENRSGLWRADGEAGVLCPL